VNDKQQRIAQQEASEFAVLVSLARECQRAMADTHALAELTEEAIAIMTTDALPRLLIAMRGWSDGDDTNLLCALFAAYYSKDKDTQAEVIGWCVRHSFPTIASDLMAYSSLSFPDCE
jgi:hypothetical protein